jgi:hypothetical protein
MPAGPGTQAERHQHIAIKAQTLSTSVSGSQDSLACPGLLDWNGRTRPHGQTTATPLMQLTEKGQAV